MNYCKTIYFHCIPISRFSNVEIELHFNLAFSQCSNSIYYADEILVMGKLNLVGILFCDVTLLQKFVTI